MMPSCPPARQSAACLWLAVICCCSTIGARAEEPAKPAADKPPANDGSGSKGRAAGNDAAKLADTASWLQPTDAVKERFRALSPEAKKKFLAALSDSNAQIQKTFTAIVQEDETAQLSKGGVPEPFFRPAEPPRAGPNRTPPGAERRGPPPEVIARYNKLSDVAKEKMRQHFIENKERLTKMNPEERKAFMEKSFNAVAEEDEAKHGKPAASEPSTDSIKKPAAPAPTESK